MAAFSQTPRATLFERIRRRTNILQTTESDIQYYVFGSKEIDVAIDAYLQIVRIYKNETDQQLKNCYSALIVRIERFLNFAEIKNDYRNGIPQHYEMSPRDLDIFFVSQRDAVIESMNRQLQRYDQDVAFLKKIASP